MEKRGYETTQDPVYYDTDDFLEPTPQVSSFCSFLSSNLGLGSLWWLSALIQLSALLPLLVLYRLCNLVPLLNFITISSIVTFYLNASLWIWSLYLILALANCGIGVENPTFVVGIVLVSIFGFFSVLDCLFGREGWYLVDLKPMKDASRYFEKIKTSPPVHRIHIECFHTNTTAALNTRGNIFTRSQKVVTYCDHRDFPLTSWSDLSEWPALETIASQGINIIGVNMERHVEPGDKETREAFDSFKNKFVQQNCHRDVEIRTWVTSEIPDMGPEQSLFITTRTKEQTPFIFNIGFYLFLAAFCLSCPLKTYIMKKTKLIPLKVSKLYFYDPNKPSAVPVPSQAINGPTTAQERVINSTQSLKSEFDKMNTMEPTSNDFPHSRSVENLNYQKQNNLTSYQPQNRGYKQWNTMESAFHNKFPQEKNLPSSNFGGRDGYSKQYNQVDGRQWRHGERDSADCMEHERGAPVSSSGLYLAGKDYYDESLYNQRQVESSHDQYYEEEERMYQTSHPHPRVAMLKNTNIEADMMARRQDMSAGRKVHYSAKEEEGYLRPAYRRYQSPSPGPRQRHQNPGGHHRSRRAYSDERDRLTEGRVLAVRGDKFDNNYYNNSCGADTERLIEEEMQYNA